MGLSIYYVERPLTETWFGETFVKSHHAYLALARETVDAPSLVEEEIHFKNEGFLRFKHHSFSSGHQSNFDGLHVYGHIGGKDSVIRPVWDEVVGLAHEITDMRLDFDGERLADSYNCRAASIALLKSIGHNHYAPTDVSTASGTSSDLWRVIQKKSHQLVA